MTALKLSFEEKKLSFEEKKLSFEEKKLSFEEKKLSFEEKKLLLGAHTAGGYTAQLVDAATSPRCRLEVPAPEEVGLVQLVDSEHRTALEARAAVSPI
jgi:hypothetical protein